MVAGVIYDPLRDEMFLAERGRGAWLNGRADRGFEDGDAAGGADGDGLSFATSGTVAPTCIFTRRLRCDRTGCGARVRRRSTWRTWRAGGWTAFGSST